MTTKQPLHIIGAGLAGLIAAHAWPQATVHEAAHAPRQQHNALLRFRSDAVSRLTGIEFRKVRVRKGIHYDGEFVQPSIRIANEYTSKTLGRLVPERSIWNIDPVDRYIAPEDFYQQLVASAGSRILWGSEFKFESLRDSDFGSVISTMPLPTLCEMLWPIGIPNRGVPQFHRAAIKVQLYRVEDCDVHQTVYFPHAGLSTYRASITGDLLIVEGVSDSTTIASEDEELDEVCSALFLTQSQLRPLGQSEQRYGKIVPIDEGTRKRLVHQMTTQHGIYSLGRFATWRNLLLDDLVDDIAALKRIMRMEPHDVRLAAS